MTSMLTSIDLIIECRDYRVPLSSTNPLFETLLQGRKRLIVFTKKDLGRPSAPGAADLRRERLLSSTLQPSHTLYASSTAAQDTKRILSHVRAHATDRNAITGSRVLVVGMPNVGKSTLLNALRRHGVGRGKAARTGAQPGITRAIAGSGVKILEGRQSGSGQGGTASASAGPTGLVGGVMSGGDVYLVDTPGVFVPYVSDAETMLKLSLVGCVKDGIVPYTTLADYLLYRVNLVDPALYAGWCAPTNDVLVFLDAVARRTGRLAKGGEPDLDASGLWVVQRFRQGHLGRFVLDEVSEEEIARTREAAATLSLSQARKREKERRGRAKGSNGAED